MLNVQLQILESCQNVQAALLFFSARSKNEMYWFGLEATQIDLGINFQTDDFAFHSLYAYLFSGFSLYLCSLVPLRFTVIALFVTWYHKYRCRYLSGFLRSLYRCTYREHSQWHIVHMQCTCKNEALWGINTRDWHYNNNGYTIKPQIE